MTVLATHVARPPRCATPPVRLSSRCGCSDLAPSLSLVFGSLEYVPAGRPARTPGPLGRCPGCTSGYVLLEQSTDTARSLFVQMLAEGLAEHREP